LDKHVENEEKVNNPVNDEKDVLLGRFRGIYYTLDRHADSHEPDLVWRDEADVDQEN
jgi:hypothetical protein